MPRGSSRANIAIPPSTIRRTVIIIAERVPTGRGGQSSEYKLKISCLLIPMGVEYPWDVDIVRVEF
jgi:hypothetical protein